MIPEILTLAFVAFYFGLRLRVVPDKLMTIWFGGCIASGFIWLYFATYPIYIASAFLKLISKRDLNKYATQLADIMLWSVRLLNPQLQVYTEFDHHKTRFEDVPSNAHIMFNHMSFWDSLNYSSIAPLSVPWTKKTLMKSSIMKMPIAGKLIFTFQDHFPVYFASDASDAGFGVDKEKQDKVMKAIDDWLYKEKKGLGYCPEGKMGSNPSVVQPLRFGMLKVVAATEAPIYICTQWQNEVFWPIKEAIGGHAADVGMTLCEYKYKGGKEPVPRNAETGEIDIAAYAADMQAFMQTEVDRLKEFMEKKGLMAKKNKKQE